MGGRSKGEIPSLNDSFYKFPHKSLFNNLFRERIFLEKICDITHAFKCLLWRLGSMRSSYTNIEKDTKLTVSSAGYCYWKCLMVNSWTGCCSTAYQIAWYTTTALKRIRMLDKKLLPLFSCSDIRAWNIHVFITRFFIDGVVGVIREYEHFGETRRNFVHKMSSAAHTSSHFKSLFTHQKLRDYTAKKFLLLGWSFY